MKNRSLSLLLAIILLTLPACGSQKSSAEAAVPLSGSVPADGSSGPGTFFTINEVGPGPNGYVALQNFTDQPASLDGLYLCQGSKCFKLPDVEVPAGSTVRVSAADGDGLENVIATRATLGGLKSSDGELGLYSSQNTTDPVAAITYLQWGSTPHENTEAAIQAGLWLEGAFAPSSDQATRLYHNEGGLWLFDE